MKELTLMIKPASSLCNLRCRYCFYRDAAEHRAVASYGVMTADILDRIVKKACAEAERLVRFIFQGGEPLLAGRDFFEAFEASVTRHAPRLLRVERSVQTNGTLIDPAWAAFFKKHNYLLGVSLDGMAELQNDLRPSVSGGGSFSAVMNGIRCLEKAGVEYNILTVVSEPVARRGGAVYRFLRKNGWNYLQFIPCLDPLDGSTRDCSLKSGSYGKFLNTTFDLYFNDLAHGEQVSVRWFDNIINLMAGCPPESCGISGQCVSQLVIEADGGTYPCDFYADDSRYLGSALEQSFGELLSSEAGRQFAEESRPLPGDCAACPVYPLCRNGCRRYRLPYMGANPGKNVLCEAWRTFFSYAGDRLAVLARLKHH